MLSAIKSKIFNLLNPSVPFLEKKPFKDYQVEVDNQYFTVYKPCSEVIVAANDKVVCTQSVYRNDIIFLYSDVQIPNHRYKIKFNCETFPQLLPNSSIQLVLIIPYITKTEDRNKKWRLVIITDRCQVYHNFPDDCKNKREAIVTFSESMVWDLPGNRYPSLNTDCESYENYFPFLPAGETQKFYSIVHENGKHEKLSRFYFPSRSAHTNPFFYLNGYEPDPIMTFIGSYCGNCTSSTASRIVVFATSDGGVNWFAKYEFNDDGRALNYGNCLRINPSTSENQDIVADYICKREFVPSENDALMLKCGERVNIKEVYQKETIEIVFEKPHNLQSGDIVALKGNGRCGVSNLLLNNDFADNDFGNGLFYKIKVINDHTIQLFECVSKSRTNLPARHIHSINRTKDGFLVATGETYPQGWLLMLSVTDADNWNNYFACDDLAIIRLNSSCSSVQRIVGAVLLDNYEHELIYASDCSSMSIDKNEIIDGIPTNSIGIYKGKLTDIEDFRKFELLEEVKEPSFFFKDLDGCYVFCGQRGELAVGLDHGKFWRHARVETKIFRYMGRTLNYFVIDGKILRIK